MYLKNKSNKQTNPKSLLYFILQNLFLEEIGGDKF